MELNNLVDVLEVFLGKTKNGVSHNGQVQFNCPACAEDKGLYDGDGKYNLDVNLYKNKFRCWSCENTNDMSGSINSLIKRYGNEHYLSMYKTQIDEIKKSKEYQFNFHKEENIFEDDEFKMQLPNNTFEFKFDGNTKESIALNYLITRGIDRNLIEKYNLMYTDNTCDNRNYRNRIIIPSYDIYGDLNYYTCRDYTNKSFRKYYNYDDPKFKVNKKDITFNENLINWDADIVLVEGPTDHLVIPNSITLLGKYINNDYKVFNDIMKKSTQNIYIFLDNDAIDDAIEVASRLYCYELMDRIKIVPSDKLMKVLNEEIKNEDDKFKKLDPSEIYKKIGRRGISMGLKMAYKYVNYLK